MDSSFFSQQMPYCLATLLVYMALMPISKLKPVHKHYPWRFQNLPHTYTKQHDIISLGFELESYFSRTSSIYFLLAFDLVCAKTNTTANYHTLTTPYISQTDGNGLIFFSFTVYYQSMY